MVGRPLDAFNDWEYPHMAAGEFMYGGLAVVVCPNLPKDHVADEIIPVPFSWLDRWLYRLFMRRELRPYRYARGKPIYDDTEYVYRAAGKSSLSHPRLLSFSAGRRGSSMEDQVSRLLSQAKVPLWARALGALRARSKRRRHRKTWYYVATIPVWIQWTDVGGYGKAWYILYQRGDGKRRYEYGHQHSLLGGWEMKFSQYGSVIAPWMAGTWDTEIMRTYAKNQKDPSWS